MFIAQESKILHFLIMGVCAKCGARTSFLKDYCNPCLDALGSKKSQQPNEKPHSASDPQKQDSSTIYALFQCLNCKADLRAPLSNGSCRCPRCKLSFHVKKVNSTPLAFIIIPENSFTTSTNNNANARRSVPPAVRSALHVFNLDETATLNDAKKNYRDLVKSYHPDLVSHLGPDLKKVAEAKTKEINSAYNILEKYFTA